MSPWNVAFLLMVVIALTGYPLLLGIVAWWSNRAPKALPAANQAEAADKPEQVRAEYPKAA